MTTQIELATSCARPRATRERPSPCKSSNATAQTRGLAGSFETTCHAQTIGPCVLPINQACGPVVGRSLRECSPACFAQRPRAIFAEVLEGRRGVRLVCSAAPSSRACVCVDRPVRGTSQNTTADHTCVCGPAQSRPHRRSRRGRPWLRPSGQMSGGTTRSFSQHAVHVKMLLSNRKQRETAKMSAQRFTGRATPRPGQHSRLLSIKLWTMLGPHPMLQTTPCSTAGRAKLAPLGWVTSPRQASRRDAPEAGRRAMTSLRSLAGALQRGAHPAAAYVACGILLERKMVKASSSRGEHRTLHKLP